MGKESAAMKVSLKGMLLWFSAIMLTFVLWAPLTSATSVPPAKGAPLPKTDLPVPNDPSAKLYLGLSGKGSFQIVNLFFNWSTKVVLPPLSKPINKIFFSSLNCLRIAFLRILAVFTHFIIKV